MPVSLSKVVFFSCCLLLAGTKATAEPVDASSRTSVLAVSSDILGEEREVFVLAPEGFDPEGEGYTTVYVLDGEWSFPLVASYLDYLARWNRIPNLVVTGVRNVDRNRDYIFAEDPSFPGTGGAANFGRFLYEEWAPMVERQFNGSGNRILVGHSFGGTFALHSMMTNPGFFDAYVAVGSSTWVAGRGLFGLAKAFLAESAQQSTVLYMAVAEADGGETVPDGIAFAKLFEERATDAIEWYFEIIDQKNHFTAVMPALVSAFEKIYPVWGMTDEVKNIAVSQGAEGLERWFDAKSRDLGFRFVLPKMELEMLAVGMAGEGRGDAAGVLLDKLLERDPDSFSTMYALGLVYSRQGRYADALIPLEDAARVARESGEPQTLIARYERAAETIRARLEAQQES